jgi:hypothetical protein
MRKPSVGEGSLRLASTLSLVAVSAILSACGAKAPKKQSDCGHASQVLAKDKFLGVMPTSRNGIAHFVIDLGNTIKIERQFVTNDTTQQILSDTTIPTANTTITYHEAYDGVPDTVIIGINAGHPQHPLATVTTCSREMSTSPAGSV